MDTAARRIDPPGEVPVEDITRIEFGGRYEHGVLRVLRHRDEGADVLGPWPPRSVPQ